MNKYPALSENIIETTYLHTEFREMLKRYKLSLDKTKLEISMNEITKEELDNFLKMQDRILNLIEEKTKELSLIIYDRLPKGEIYDLNIYESEFKPDCIFVEFEEHRCGESNMDQYNLPMRFLWDKDYPVVFKREHEKSKRIEEEKYLEEKLIIEKSKLRSIEKFDRSEYERLKAKYEMSDIPFGIALNECEKHEWYKVRL